MPNPTLNYQYLLAPSLPPFTWAPARAQPGLGGLRPKELWISLPSGPLRGQPKAKRPGPPHRAPKHDLLLWEHVIMSLGAHGWGGGLVHVGGAAPRRLCRCAHKPAEEAEQGLSCLGEGLRGHLYVFSGDRRGCGCRSGALGTAPW